ncbi:MAG: energy-coupling factor transporter transmembrane protein EcfT [Clostridiales Family XIII bacterium]|jgi:energy-coupling factor transport system permease protein|nr:energy-coupling factor transporter transmembrane protein EcfT [Clostridiales Family XIII bacterium]
MVKTSPANIFSHYHPAAVLLYIAAAVFCAMFTLMPACVVLSFVCSSAYSIFLNGVRAYAKALRPLLIIFVIIVLVNPVTNHRGMTVLFHLFGNPGMPVTWEATLRGLCSGGMLMSIFVWFQCYQALITNDKFMYLFGRIAPTSAMVVSMVLKLVPVTIRKYHEIDESQSALRMSSNPVDGRKGRIRAAVKVSGVLLSRTMEDSIETADSMRARGYGSGHRTRFSNYRLTAADIICIVILAALLVTVVSLIVIANRSVNFFPVIRIPDNRVMNGTLLAAYALMLLAPLFIEMQNLRHYTGERSGG